MMKIAVVGATGPTGIQLVTELRKTIASVRVIARSTDSLARLFPETAVEKWPADVLDADATRRAIEGCDLVYDCIGLPGDQMHLHPVTARNIAGALHHTKARCVPVSSYWAESNIMRRAAPKPGRRPTREWKGLPPPTREPLAERPSKSLQHNLEDLTRGLEAELRGSPPRRSQSSPPPPRGEAQSTEQSTVTSLDLEPRSRPRFNTGAEPKGEPKIQDEIQPEKSLDESTEPEDKEDVQHRT